MSLFSGTRFTTPVGPSHLLGPDHPTPFDRLGKGGGPNVEHTLAVVPASTTCPQRVFRTIVRASAPSGGPRTVFTPVVFDDAVGVPSKGAQVDEVTLDGWPATRHTAYDSEGNRTGSWIVQQGTTVANRRVIHVDASGRITARGRF